MFLVLIQKPDLSLRICFNPKTLNESLVRDYFPVPTLEKLTSNLIEKQFYSAFNLKDGYYHIELDAKSNKFCTFSKPFRIIGF